MILPMEGNSFVGNPFHSYAPIPNSPHMSVYAEKCIAVHVVSHLFISCDLGVVRGK